ncbi:MAG TPA: tetratricopeptide repeat protein [Candidatus Acidoferrales bacterium]|nr:tetratricopeptide repeat protein [Candidatus Acidoferrales bacterium]
MAGDPASFSKEAGPDFCFGPFRLNTESGVLLRGEEPVPLTPKVFRALLYLLENSGRLVTKDELMKVLWADAFVTESNLTQTMFVLRKALGAGKDGQRYIATVPGRGYRFVAGVRRLTRDAQAAPAAFRMATGAGMGTVAPNPPDLRPGRATDSPAPNALPANARFARGPTKRIVIRTITALAAVLLIAGAFVGLSRWLESAIVKPPESPIRSLAVLPLKDLSGDRQQAYFAEGMTDELITRLADIAGLRVISHTSVARYADSAKSLPEIASELHVDAIIEGTIVRDSNRVRINAQLVRGTDDRHLWAASYERELRDALDLQDEIARDVAHHITLQLNPAARARLESRETVEPQALALYLRGRYHWHTRDVADLNQAVSEFQQAAAIDPKFALPYAGLADCYVVLPLLSRDRASDLYPKAKQAAERALALDPSSAEVHTSVAYAKLYQDWDFAGAEREFQTALELNPNYSTAHQWYAEMLSMEGRFPEAIMEIQTAEQLDPFAPVVYHEAGQVYRQARRYPEALEEYKKALALNSGIPGWWIADVYFRLGRVHDAAETWAGTVAGSGDSARKREITAEWERAYRAQGTQGWIRKVMEMRGAAQRPSYFLALGYAGLGDDDKALEYLDRAYAARDLEVLTLDVDPEWDRLHSDPRFISIAKKVGVPGPEAHRTN